MSKLFQSVSEKKIYQWQLYYIGY